MENSFGTPEKSAHFRITVKTYYKGQEIDKKTMEDNLDIKNALPSLILFKEKYLEALIEAQSNQFEYLLTVTEKGITIERL